jgi:hypothetical protein
VLFVERDEPQPESVEHRTAGVDGVDAGADDRRARASIPPEFLPEEG